MTAIGIGINITHRRRGGNAVSGLLTSDGDGSGVNTLKLEVSEDITLSLDGSAKFYDDAGGTTNEGTTRTVTAGALRTFYLKVPSGTANLKFSDKTKVTKIGETTTSGWEAGTNAAILNGEFFAEMVNLTNLSAFSCKMIGDVSSWSALTSLTYLRCNSNSLEGDVSSWSALTSLTYLFCSSNSLEGDVSSWSALTSLTYLRCNSNSLEGDVSSWSALTSLTYLFCYSNSLDFDTTTAWAALDLGTNCQWQNNAMTSTQVDNALIAFAGGPFTNTTIDLSGTNAARTSASDAAVATLEAAGCTIVTS